MKRILIFIPLLMAIYVHCNILLAQKVNSNLTDKKQISEEEWESSAAFKNIKSAKIIVSQNVAFTNNKKKNDLFVKKTFASLLEYANIKEDEQNYDIIVQIDIKGKALGQYYKIVSTGQSVYSYSGASLWGTIIFEDRKGTKLIEEFEEIVEPPTIIESASVIGPFDKAFYKAMPKFMKSLYAGFGLKPIINALNGKDLVFRRNAAQALLLINDPQAIKPLVEAFSVSRDQSLQLDICMALEKMEPNWYYIETDISLVPSLIISLGDSYANIREMAALILGSTHDSRAVEPLLLAMNDKNKDVRLAAVKALQRINDKRAVESLCSALTESSGPPDYRVALAEALGILNDKRAVEPLITALNSKDYSVRKASAEALGKINDSLAVESLISALKDEFWGLKCEAARALGTIKDSRAVEPLLIALRDENEYVRLEAAEALGNIKDNRAVDPIIAAFNNTRYRSEVMINAIGNIGGIRAEKFLISQLDNDNYNVSEAAVVSLDTIDPSWRNSETAKAAVPIYIDALKNSFWFDRRRAADALGLIRDNRAVVPLKNALKDQESAVRKSASVALKNITGIEYPIE
jgi:HEAT repeat protein